MSENESRSRKVTSFDVARQAGVSRAAVSRTFTPDASVSPQTREKVHKAAKELGYRVNYLARSLTNQRSDLVGVVAAGFDNPFRPQQIEQIARALLARNFRPVLLPTSHGADPSELIGQLLHYNVSGVVVTSDTPPSALCEECADYGVPIVLINKGDDIPLVDRVVSDDKSAGQIAATCLIESGANRPAAMGAAGSYSARRRIDAFVARCKALGVVADVLPIAINDYRHGFDGAAQLHGTNIDALFCANDYLACGVIDRLRQDRPSRRSSPIRIIGHDDIPQASWAAYDLTTFQQPCDTQAEQAIDLLVSRMEDPKLTARVEFTPVTLVQRKTA